MSTQLAREELERAAPDGPCAVTVGKFDGVHLGHRHLVGALNERAKAHRLSSAVVTLHPHPITVLRPGTLVTYLCSLEERVALLRGLGIDGVAVLSFTSELAQLSYGDFMALLTDALDLKLLVVGPDFAVGRDRQGDVDALRTLGRERGFEVDMVSLLEADSAKVGSGAIREALAVGDMPLVAELLGRPFALRGPVVRGAARGRTIGFPTANIAVAPDLALPSFGVYVTRAFIGETTYEAVTNIGQRPTFGETRPIIETHMLDFDGDIYEREVRIEPLSRLRGERRFSGPDELVAQIKRDVEEARSQFQREAR